MFCDIDPAKVGKTTHAFGATAPVPDTRVCFLVAHVGQATVLYSGQFKELSGDGAESSWTARATAILIRNYLVPKGPGIGEWNFGGEGTVVDAYGGS